MTQDERRIFLIRYLQEENPRYKDLEIPKSEAEQKYLLRSLLNVREAIPASQEFLKVQDEYLCQANRERGLTRIEDLEEFGGLEGKGIFLWRGDITTLKVGAIVNAANSAMTGCWQPCHSCIDNCIHTYSGIQLRKACSDLMQKQGHPEPTGRAKITPAFNLPCDFVIHTVGPIIRGPLTNKDCEQLSSCYKSCLKAAAQKQVESIAFCCISTGVFMFPPERAAQIAVKTVMDWKEKNASKIKVVFNVFSQKDQDIYKKILSAAG